MAICVIGAGVVGLTTALELKRILKNNIKVTLIAENFDQNTTSYGAAGIFRPATSFSGPDLKTTKEWINYSYQYYSNLLNESCGVSEISGYLFSKIDPSLVKNHFLEGLVKEYRDVTNGELELCPGGWKYGSFFSTLLIECSEYLPYARKRFLNLGGEIIKARVDTFEDLNQYGNFPIVVNCAGLGAKKLCKDEKIVPISGQVFKIKAPWLSHFYYGDYDTYIIPGKLATLGGTRHYDSAKTDVSKYDSAAIWDRCVSLVPRLKTAEVVKEWVGLRPHRDGGVRVDCEIRNGFKVVHNYGHGGYGVTTAPGTAKHAALLVYKLLTASKL